MLQNVKVGNKYSWIKGENFGKEDVVKNPKLRVGSMNFIEFVSGRRISVALSKEYLSLIAEAEELEIEDPEAFVKELAERESNLTQNTPIKKEEKKVVQINSIYADILDKIKSYEDTDIELKITVSLPKKAALEVLLDAYGEDLAKELNIYIENKISDDVKSQIKDTINNWIKDLNINIDENNKSTTQGVLEMAEEKQS